MSVIRPVNDDVKKIAFEKVAQVRIYQLHLMAQVIDLAMKRGAFVASEASQIGALFDTLAAGVNKAYDITEKELRESKEANEIKLPVIKEDKEE
jgi:hypothetical protein